MEEYKINPFEKFNKEWALLTAGTKEKFNSMTISWGTMGTIWHKNVITIYIRPDRYTFEFLEKNKTFTLSFYDEKYKDELTMFGRKSGRDIDKVKESGFTPIILENGITYKEAKETIVLKKLYMEQIKKENLTEEIKEFYKEDIPTHYIIIGEIMEIKK